MKIAVLSGKGGTGKTFVSVNLAEVLEEGVYVDCDVEEPNGHLFFKPVWLEIDYITRKLPTIDQDICNGCRVCTDFCKFNALAYIADKVIVFEEICHSCSGCTLFCPQNAITEKDKDHVVIDCPPGSACSVMENIKDADYCLLVAEPTIST